jgi:NAD(P)-dependent dehydrogenase (short-subunit alcohol dehydrogenase family)
MLRGLSGGLDRAHALRERQGRLDLVRQGEHADQDQLAFADMADGWTADRVPDQSGRIAVVTGANSGLGLVTARELASKGALVVMACRNMEKGRAALAQVAAAASGPEPELEELDLASLSSVRSFAERVKSKHDGLDLLINNAGVMAPPRRHTADGFELQFGTNHLGHFALTGLLLPLMEGREDARVVTLSSNAHKTVRGIAFDNLNGDRRYFRWNAYGQSKLANLLFALELDRRLRARDSSVKSLSAHPGYSATNLQNAAAPLVDRLVMKVANAVVAQSDEMGALPTLYAATDPGLAGGSYVGPDGIAEQRGHPKIVKPNRAARDEDTARRLWDVSQDLTGVR